jgi:dTMP kinase
MTPRGALIVVEGLDRAGKSTQVERLCNNLRTSGHPVQNMRFPDRSTAIGQSINAYLQSSSDLTDHVIHLLFSANRWECSDKIRSSIASGTTLVIDRYSYSGAVYSAAKLNPQLDLEWAWAPDIGLPLPDMVVFLTISPDKARERGGYGEERYETVKMQEQVREKFQELLYRVPGRVMRIDAGESIEEVETEILQAVEGALNLVKIEGSELGSLGPLRLA